MSFFGFLYQIKSGFVLGGFFSHAIPLLIPFQIGKRVKFIMKDGNVQQCNEILKALKEVFPNALEGGCG